MAMLVLPDVFARTWGRIAVRRRSGRMRIAQVRAAHPDFVFMAEVYWDREWALQQQGFDFTYDKRLYDRLHAGDAAGRARAPARRPRLPGQLGPLPREPRRAAAAPCSAPATGTGPPRR